jgi:hypothetical protein
MQQIKKLFKFTMIQKHVSHHFLFYNFAVKIAAAI